MLVVSGTLARSMELLERRALCPEVFGAVCAGDRLSSGRRQLKMDMLVGCCLSKLACSSKIRSLAKPTTSQRTFGCWACPAAATFCSLKGLLCKHEPCKCSIVRLQR